MERRNGHRAAAAPAEIASQAAPKLGENHPLAHLAGSRADDPEWEEYLAAIEAYRAEQNQAEPDPFL